MPVQAPLRPDALAPVSRVEPLRVHARGDDVRDFRGRGEGEDFLEDRAARDDDAVGLAEEDTEVEAQASLEQMEVQAERGVERQGVVDHRVERRHARDLRLPGRPDPFDPHEPDAVDVDHVDPEVLDQVRLPSGEHREPIARIVPELLRSNVDRPGLAHPAAPRVLRREDDDLMAVSLELPARRQDGRHDAVDGREIAIGEEGDSHGITDRGKGSRSLSASCRSRDGLSSPPPRLSKLSLTSS